MADLSRKLFMGIVEDNQDPTKEGRVRVRVQSLYNFLKVEDIPWAQPFMDLAGKEFKIPAIGKIVNVLYLCNDLYAPYYIYSEKYNINLQKKLNELSDEEYVKFVALLFDERTQIYAMNDELTIDHVFNKMTISKWGINLELKDNKQILNLGSRDADQEAVLGTHWFDWFDKFVNKLLEPTSLIGNLGGPIVKAELDQLLTEYQQIRKTFVSNHVKIVDNNEVSMLERDSLPTQDDGVMQEDRDTDTETPLQKAINKQNKDACSNISEAIPSDPMPEMDDPIGDEVIFTVKRWKFLGDRTIGKLYLNNQYLCDTLEDKVRDLRKEKKIYGETAIPYGTYQLTVGPTGLSKKTAPTGRLPLVNNVQYFEGIRIHKWGKPKDTMGCLLVGDYRQSDETLINYDQRSSEILQMCENYQAKKIKMRIIYMKEEDPSQLVANEQQPTNNYRGSDYVVENPNLEKQISTNPEQPSQSNCNSKIDSSWKTNLETQDYALNGEELKYNGEELLVSEEQLRYIMPQASNKNINKFLMPINMALEKFNLKSPLVICAFLSQIAIESGNLIYVREIGDETYCKKYEPNTPKGQELGNIEPGDGYKYKGRGLIQVTGRANYKQLSQQLGQDFENIPQMMEDPIYASLSACAWWVKRIPEPFFINDKAERKDIKAVTKVVNGGYGHLTERTAIYKRALKAYNIA